MIIPTKQYLEVKIRSLRKNYSLIIIAEEIMNKRRIIAVVYAT